MRTRSLLLCLGTLGAVVGCARDDTRSHTSAAIGDVGSVRMAIAVAPGLDIETVAYSIQVPEHEALQGTLPVDADGTVRGTVSDVPAAEGVVVSLTASNDAGVTCSGEGSVTVRAGEVVNLSIGLQCRLPPGMPSPTTGAIAISGTFNACPKVLAASADPASTEATSAVTASGEDADGDTLSFNWSADSGAFADEAGASTTYTCAAAGEQTLTVTVDDGRGCTHSKPVVVTCTAPAAPVCGDGEKEGEEACDDGNTADGDGCSATCAVEPEGSDIPCDVQAVLQAKCQNCHGQPPAGGPMPLVTLEDLRADSFPPNAGTPVWQRVKVRIGDDPGPIGPMPPSYSANGALTAEEQATLSAWLEAGARGGNCGAPQ